jgi:hypothetical protein
MLFLIVFISVGFLGYLAQTTGLCMVRGMNEWKAGNKEFLFSILFSGVLAWVAAYFSYLTNLQFNVKTYSLSAWFILGGVIFGLGTALNKSCGVSTLSRLTRGDSRMFSTILGWLIGWIIIAQLSIHIEIVRNPSPGKIYYIPLIIVTLAIIIWTLIGNRKRKSLWFGMMGIGFLSSFIYLYQPKWPPSALLHQISQALLSNKVNIWPSLEQYILFIALLLGMFLAAWRTKKFIFVPSNLKHWVEHLFAGTLMGLGASLAMGGNSVQLLLALPIFSPAGFGAIGGMLLGIWIGLYIRKHFNLFN